VPGGAVIPPATRPDGTKVDILGANPKANAVFESNGTFHPGGFFS